TGTSPLYRGVGASQVAAGLDCGHTRRAMRQLLILAPRLARAGRVATDGTGKHFWFSRVVAVRQPHTPNPRNAGESSDAGGAGIQRHGCSGISAGRMVMGCD